MERWVDFRAVDQLVRKTDPKNVFFISADESMIDVRLITPAAHKDLDEQSG